MFLVWENNPHYLWSSNRNKHKFTNDILKPQLLLGGSLPWRKSTSKNISPLCTGCPKNT